MTQIEHQLTQATMKACPLFKDKICRPATEHPPCLTCTHAPVHGATRRPARKRGK